MSEILKAFLDGKTLAGIIGGATVSSILLPFTIRFFDWLIAQRPQRRLIGRARKRGTTLTIVTRRRTVNKDKCGKDGGQGGRDCAIYADLKGVNSLSGHTDIQGVFRIVQLFSVNNSSLKIGYFSSPDPPNNDPDPFDEATRDSDVITFVGGTYESGIHLSQYSHCPYTIEHQENGNVAVICKNTAFDKDRWWFLGAGGSGTKGSCIFLLNFATLIGRLFGSSSFSMLLDTGNQFHPIIKYAPAINRWRRILFYFSWLKFKKLVIDSASN